MSEHVCHPPLLARLDKNDVLVKCESNGELWRCECGQLWQNSYVQGDWIVVEPAYEDVMRGFGLELP